MNKQCTKCNKNRPITDFRWKIKAKKLRVNWCKACSKLRRKELYDKSKQKFTQDKYLNKRAQRVANGTVSLPPVKTCTVCQNIKPISEFKWRIKALNLKLAYCKRCDRIKRAKIYRTNPSVKQRVKHQTDKLKSIVYEFKVNQPCMDCGQIYPPYVMDFDHRNPKEKVSKISNLMRLGSVKKLLVEIEKCDLVCSNCHRIRTFTRQESSDG